MNEPSASFARVVRADPKRAGLLVAGTESGMYVSFDDGDNWQSLQLNLPNTSYRDIAFAGNDLVVGTYGRGIWILDDYAVLRQMTPAVAAEPVHLFKPDPTVRMRRNTNFDTPFPPEVPHALNPPDGVILYYSLAVEAVRRGHDRRARLGRHACVTCRASPAAPVKEAARPPHPNFWLAPPQSLADGGRSQSHQLGPSLRRAAGVHALVRDQCESGAHADESRKESSRRRARTRSSSR